MSLFKKSLDSRSKQDDLAFKLETIELNNTDSHLYANRLKTAKKKKTVLSENSPYINVDKVEIKSGGLFYGKYMEFFISVSELGLSVVRTEAEFKWLIDYLQKEFPFTPLPPLNKSTESSQEAELLKNAKETHERFLNNCIIHPDLRHSLALEIFVSTPNKEELEKRTKDIHLFFDKSVVINKALTKKGFDSLNTDVLKLFPTASGTVDLKISAGIRTHLQATEGQYHHFIALFDQLDKLQTEATAVRKKLATVSASIKSTFIELQRIALKANTAKPCRSMAGLVEDGLFSAISAFYDNHGKLKRKSRAERTETCQ